MSACSVDERPVNRPNRNGMMPVGLLRRHKCCLNRFGGEVEHYTIVVVENDPLLRAEASVLLAEAGFVVEACASAAAAASLIDERGDEIGAVFADMGASGGMDGIELATRVTMRWPRITVLVTSSRSAQPPEALPMGVRFMPKPWLPLNLLVAMQRAAEAREPGVLLI